MKIPQITLRPHHFLCLQGYKGYNYNQGQVRVWDKIANILKENPNTIVRIGEGKDSLCKTCPAAKASNSGVLTCIEQNIKTLDKKVEEILNLKIGDRIKYSSIVRKMKAKITKNTHEKLCSKCFWWQKGLCHESFKK